MQEDSYASAAVSVLQLQVEPMSLQALVSAVGNATGVYITEVEWKIARRNGLLRGMLHEVDALILLKSKAKQVLESYFLSRYERSIGVELMSELIGNDLRPWAVKVLLKEKECAVMRLNESLIHGYGVFATCTIPPNVVITEYSGVRRTDIGNSHYPFGTTTLYGDIIDALNDEGEVTCIGAMINDYGSTRIRPNAEMVEFDGMAGRVFIRTLEEIIEGDEITVSYGQSYWSGTPGKINDATEECEVCHAIIPCRLRLLHKETSCQSEKEVRAS